MALVYRGTLRKSCLTCCLVVDDSERVTGTPEVGSSTDDNRPMHVSSVGNSRIKLWLFRKNPGESLVGRAFTVTNPLELTLLIDELISCHSKLYDLRERLARSTIPGLEGESVKNGGVVRGQSSDRCCFRDIPILLSLF